LHFVIFKQQSNNLQKSKSMNTRLKLLGICGGILAAGTVVQAQITYSTLGSVSTWSGTPVYTSLASGTPLSGLASQGGLAITGSYGVLAETFTPTTSFTVGSFSLMDQFTSAGSAYQVNLFDLGPAGTVSVSSSTATYTPSTSLFSDTVAATTSSGEVQGVFALPVADQVALNAGEEYALEIWTPSADGQNGFIWYRGSTADPGGQMFSDANSANARGTLAGNGQAGGAPRTGALALYSVPVPEPGSLALMGLGGVVSMFLVRRRQS
jgi:hypothetical protein